jgi:predicted metal-binding protein
MKEALTFSSILHTTNEKYPLVTGVEIDPKDIDIEERVKMSCFYCSKYNNNWKCPPKIPPIDYAKMFSEYDHAALVWLKMPVTKETFEDVRHESALQLHKALLVMEEYLMNTNHALAMSFIGGSCRLCKNGCSKEQCSNPYKARSPIEATGVNVIKIANKYGVTISFPTNETMIRMGLLLW